MKLLRLWIVLSCVAVSSLAALEPEEDFSTSLHATRVGKPYWYGASNGGFEKWTGVPIERLGCQDCHGPVNADGEPYAKTFPGAGCIDCHPSATGRFDDVTQQQCLGCHGRQAMEAQRLGLGDVHREAGLECWDCHGSDDLHGDGTTYASMLEPGAIDVDCTDCHERGGLSAEHDAHDPHDGALHCSACHVQTVISCYNCHFESQVEAHVKRAKQPLHGFVMLVNRDEDGKVHPASFQSLTYRGSAFVAFAPYAAHTVSRAGRDCADCHADQGGRNEAIAEYNASGLIRFTRWDAATRSLSWIHGVVPLPRDYRKRLAMEFLTFDGDPAVPAGEDRQNWSAIGKRSWDGSQLFFASPLSREQMDKLGFALALELDVEPGACPNPTPKNQNGAIRVAVLGTSELDVRRIDLDSLRLQGVPARKSGFKDVGAPADGALCACGSTGPDGREDLVLRFVLADSNGTPGDADAEALLVLRGSLKDGTPIVGSDCSGAPRTSPAPVPSPAG